MRGASAGAEHAKHHSILCLCGRVIACVREIERIIVHPCVLLRNKNSCSSIASSFFRMLNVF